MRRPREIHRLIKKWGGKTIKSITICKTPVTNSIQSFLNLLTMDAFSNITNKMGYTEMWHVFMFLTFYDGSKVKLDKDPLVRVDLKANPDQIRNKLDIKVPTGITLRKLFQKAEQENDNLYKYTPWEFNCQDFVETLVGQMGIDASKFILQKYGIAFTPNLKTLTQGIVNIMIIVQRIIRSLIMYILTYLLIVGLCIIVYFVIS